MQSFLEQAGYWAVSLADPALIEQTLDIGWQVIDPLSDTEIKRIKPELIEKYRRRTTTQ